MKIGKVSENVLKRAIIGQIQTKREEVLVGAGVGEDCAVLRLKEDEVFVISTDPITGTSKDVGLVAMHVTANDLASSGAEPVGVMLTILLPESFQETQLRALMQQMEEAAGALNLQIMGGHTEVTAIVNQPLITVAGVGKAKKDKVITSSGARAGQDVVVSKWIGLEGTAIIAKEKEGDLLECFSSNFVEKAKGFDQYMSVVKEGAVAVKSNVSAMHDVTEGGIFGALWEIAEASGVGLEIDMKKIPIRQETIEVCEVFDINPYGLISSGSMLMTCDNGYDLVRELEKEGILATVVGKVTDGKDRILRNEDEIRYLEPPKQDELYKIYK